MAFPSVPEAVIGNFPHSWDNWLPATQGAIVPVNCAMQLGQKNRGLYKIAVPFSYQLCYRYLYGLDLDYSDNSLKIARGTKLDKGSIKYLVCISVAHGGSEPQRYFDFNREIYTELE